MRSDERRPRSQAAYNRARLSPQVEKSGQEEMSWKSSTRCFSTMN